MQNKDIVVDTRDLYRYDNILDFVATGLGQDKYIHTRIAFLLLDVHGEICWHCSDKSDVPVVHELTLDQFKDRFALTENGVCPRCKRTRFDRLRQGLWSVPNVACLMLGQRSGKDIASVFALLYAEHRLQVLEHNGRRVTPSEFYGLSNLKLACTTVGMSAQNANIVDYAHNFRTHSEWFQTYFSIISMYEAKYGIELHKNTKHHIRYHNNVNVYAESASDYRLLRGATRFMTIIPESSWLYTEKASSIDDVVDLEPILTTLDTGNKTIRNASRSLSLNGVDAPSPLILTTTSPRSGDDFAHQLEKKSYFDRSIYFARHATWEVNPRYKKENLFAGPDVLSKDMRDFACIVD